MLIEIKIIDSLLIIQPTSTINHNKLATVYDEFKAVIFNISCYVSNFPVLNSYINNAQI